MGQKGPKNAQNLTFFKKSEIWGHFWSFLVEISKIENASGKRKKKRFQTQTFWSFQPIFSDFYQLYEVVMMYRKKMSNFCAFLGKNRENHDFWSNSITEIDYLIPCHPKNI